MNDAVGNGMKWDAHKKKTMMKKKNDQPLCGARNNDGCNVTSNKFNEITGNFPNGQEKRLSKLCDTRSNAR